MGKEPQKIGKSRTTRMKTISITITDEHLKVLQDIAEKIGNLTYSAAIRYLIAQYAEKKKEKKEADVSE